MLPESADLKTPPPSVPAYIIVWVAGLIASAVTDEPASPTLVQVLPESVLLNTPPPFVPAYSVAGVAELIAKAFTSMFVSPVLA